MLALLDDADSDLQESPQKEDINVVPNQINDQEDWLGSELSQEEFAKLTLSPLVNMEADHHENHQQQDENQVPDQEQGRFRGRKTTLVRGKTTWKTTESSMTIQ